MKFTRLGTVSIIAMTSALALTGCVPTDLSDASGPSGTIIGAGASSQQAAQEAWVRGFQLANVAATVEYDPIGSGGGRDTFIGGGAVFAASDRAFKVEEIAEADFVSCVPGTGILEIPAYISPIAIIFNLEGIDSLNLDAETIAGIFTGEIDQWDDAAIAEQNPTVELPSLNITAVHRADDSGTTANFTDYLSGAAPDAWTVGSIEKWPLEYGGEAAPQTSGVVDAVTNGTGTIGYADASRAGDLGTVAVKVGDEYVSYSAEAAAAIVDVSPFGEGRGDTDFAVDIDRASTASGVYPVVLISYLIACNEYAATDRLDVIKGYLNYVISPEGQQAAAASAGSAPISDSLYEKALAAVAAMK
ncbi:phosphate ABC transporter substrate-binding protein PstS [Salinibacterium sp. NSLL150]|uniref:phosphate ABC transporter substrate-binding protein PstS n=1 Tax=unclassified Salinibacterium TaxID=2632331 RepID=UPI0018CE2818|nr:MULTISPECIES: phosphate ABC transporter substrate-binding protein PstS [unclassified Salinibacterium]MBH0098378.1 phosphate ABC transporter substrate-binding protein PstS [Salinibacterium sp. NSLL35]MBH0101133.1 phosphate ABC transporter substrate-binding protein PstS [Salinibacterium sp. NSLL150]MBH0103892.1 phosphate ABC transporter substrate-binding protein PstS [Salinibacterium sp. NSLL16]MBH0106653.1 phosphate ABC transporter substrate-binding protein PstS [Salinibacterium sp. NSLL17]